MTNANVKNFSALHISELPDGWSEDVKANYIELSIIAQNGEVSRSSLSDEVERLKAGLIDGQDKVDNLATSVANVRDSIGLSSDDIRGVLQVLSSVEQKQDALSNDVASINSSIEALEQNLMKISELANDHSVSIDAMAQEIEKLKQS